MRASTDGGDHPADCGPPKIVRNGDAHQTERGELASDEEIGASAETGGAQFTLYGLGITEKRCEVAAAVTLESTAPAIHRWERSPLHPPGGGRGWELAQS